MTSRGRRLLLFFLLLPLLESSTEVFKCAGDKTGSNETCSSRICFAYRHGEYSLAGCYKEGGEVNCTAIGSNQAECHLKQQSKGETREEECCCRTNMCNTHLAIDATADHVSKFFYGGGAALAILGLVIFVFFVRKWYVQRKANTAAGGDDIDNHDTDYSLCVPHADFTSLQPVIAETEQKEIKAVIKRLKQRNARALSTVNEPQQSPRVAKLVTYCTTDEITSREQDQQIEYTPDDDLSSSQNLLIEMMKRGPVQFPFNEDQLRTVLLQCADLCKEEPTLLSVPVPCTVYGDIHGQYSDLLRWMNMNGWPHRARSVFLGDLVDRGSHGVEVVALLAVMKVCFPSNVYIVRGNHEEESMNRNYSFLDECNARFPHKPPRPPLYSAFRQLFSHIPLSVVIGGKILGMHGGLSPRLASLDDIRNIQRPIEEFEVGTLACDLVWSDPDVSKGGAGYRPNIDREPMQGIGQLFASDTVTAACERLGVEMIVRGHQAPLLGYALFATGKLITLFSAPGYKGTTNENVNMGATLEINAKLEITIKQIKVTEDFRNKRIDDAINQKQIIARFKELSSV